MKQDSSAFDTDVIIIGSGPTGATLALALATYGIRAHLVSRTKWLADSPRAHITNQRAMEVFRDLGLSVEIEQEATPWQDMGDMLFTTSLAGEELVRLRAWGTGDARRSDYLNASPCGMVDIIQPKIEPILFKNAAERGITFSFNTEYLSHHQDTNGVSVNLRDKLTGREYAVKASYLFGADGARSAIVDELNLPIEGHMARAGTVYTVFNADLTRYVCHRPSTLNWIVSPHTSFGEIGMGLLRAVLPWTQWIAGWGFDISKGDPDLSEATIRAGIATMIGDPNIGIDIVRTSVWYVNQAYATEYSRGRVLCGGDAVHRHPPSSGLGMNTCVQDAFNAAWKLAFVLKGFAGEQLLTTYSTERAPVGKQIVERANQSRRDYAPLNACFRVPGAPNPVAAGIARLKSSGPEGVAIRRAIQEALDLKNTEFNAQGVEMNQRYRSTAVLNDDEDQRSQLLARDATLFVNVTTSPGAKIPHAWLIDEAGMRISTLDLVGRGLFSLVTGLSGQAWVQAAEALALPYLRAVVVGANYAQDVYCDWQRLREIEEAGVLLVRPDGYIAWRMCEGIYDATRADLMLRKAFATLLDDSKLLHNKQADT